MDIFQIQGGVPLNGTVRVSGAKNAALPIMAAALLADGPVDIVGAPRLRDIHTFCKLLGTMGASVEWLPPDELGRETLRIDGTTLSRPEATYDLVKTMRASVLVLGPLLARLKSCKVSITASR